MTENLKKLLEEASKNEELKAKLAALTDPAAMAEKAIAIAKEYGLTLTPEDFRSAEGEELSLDELDAVAGGNSEGWCPPLGTGGPCGCTMSGLGKASASDAADSAVAGSIAYNWRCDCGPGVGWY